jgi:outer membrane receptor for ferrienterochelin and colicins
MFLRRTIYSSAAGNKNRNSYIRAEGNALLKRAIGSGGFSVALGDSFYSRERDNYTAAGDTWAEDATYDKENLASLEIDGYCGGFDGWMLSGGLDASFNSMEKSNFKEDFVFRDREAVFLQAERFTPDVFSVAGGVRVERDSYFGFAAAPKISAMRRLGAGFRVLGGGGLGYRAPDFTDLYIDQDASESYRVGGNENLKPEVALSFNAALEYAASAGFAMLNGYYTELWDEIVNVPAEKIGNKQYYQRQNKKRTLRGGVDAEARVELPLNLFIGAGYSWLLAWDREAAELIYPQPEHTVKAKLGVNVKKHGVYAHVAARFFSGMPEDDYTESRFLLDFYASVALSKHWSVNAACDNITGAMLTTRAASVNAPRFSLGAAFVY